MKHFALILSLSYHLLLCLVFVALVALVAIVAHVADVLLYQKGVSVRVRFAQPVGTPPQKRKKKRRLNPNTMIHMPRYHIYSPIHLVGDRRARP